MSSQAQDIDKKLASSAKQREVDLDLYRNIGIMAHIDAGKVRIGFFVLLLKKER